MTTGQKILDGLKDAVAGNLARVTIDGQTWERIRPSIDEGGKSRMDDARQELKRRIQLRSFRGMSTEIYLSVVTEEMVEFMLEQMKKAGLLK
jgi:hypothetical protein